MGAVLYTPTALATVAHVSLGDIIPDERPPRGYSVCQHPHCVRECRLIFRRGRDVQMCKDSDDEDGGVVHTRAILSATSLLPTSAAVGMGSAMEAIEPSRVLPRFVPRDGPPPKSASRARDTALKHLRSQKASAACAFE